MTLAPSQHIRDSVEQGRARGETPSQIMQALGIDYVTYRAVVGPVERTETALRSARELRPHGTRAAYTRHHRHGEKPCVDCLRWRRDDTWRRRLMKGAA